MPLMAGAPRAPTPCAVAQLQLSVRTDARAGLCSVSTTRPAVVGLSEMLLRCAAGKRAGYAQGGAGALGKCSRTGCECEEAY